MCAFSWDARLMQVQAICYLALILYKIGTRLQLHTKFVLLNLFQHLFSR